MQMKNARKNTQFKEIAAGRLGWCSACLRTDCKADDLLGEMGICQKCAYSKAPSDRDEVEGVLSLAGINWQTCEGHECRRRGRPIDMFGDESFPLCPDCHNNIKNLQETDDAERIAAHYR
jgi:protein-arginine kinase activator protein McsA